MKKFIITGMAVAMLAVPSAAMADVNVDANGNGFVGKGDVQNALSLGSDQGMQDLFKLDTNQDGQPGDEIKFTTSYKTGTDNTRICMQFGGPGEPVFVPVPGAEPVHVIISKLVTQDAKVTANVNNAGKLTNGWNLNGFDGAKTYGPQTTETIGTCPAGSIGATKTISVVGMESARSGLQVTGNGITADLPNTPVVTPAA
jgi:hypothetical protein